MKGINVKKLTLNLDGKTIEFKNLKKRGFTSLNKAVLTNEGYANFANNPKKFASQFGIVIDDELSNKLNSILKGSQSMEELKEAASGSIQQATLWAVVLGAYSIATTKVAVAC